MRVVCPSCNAAYNIPEASLAGAPRRLRCARCQTEWTVDAPLDPALPAPPSADTAPAPAEAARPGPMARMVEASLAGPPPDPGPITGIAGSGEGTVVTATPASVAPPEPALAMNPAAAGPLVAVEKLAASQAPDARSPRAGPKLSVEDRMAAEARARVRAQHAATTGNVVLAWLLSFAVLALCATAAILFRKEVVHAWPPSERVYLSVGLR